MHTFFLKRIDSVLNGIPMYRVVLYGLLIIQSAAILLGFLGLLPYGGLAQSIHVLVITLGCYVSNRFFAWIVKAQTNTESVFITALILSLLLWPIVSLEALTISFGAGVLAMASKYILVWKKVHIFNPAAFSVFLLGLFGQGVVIWWAGSLILLPFTLAIGFLIVRKIRRMGMILWFFGSASVSVFVYGLIRDVLSFDLFQSVFLSGPIVFFAGVMLTEPFTTPPTYSSQRLYGILVGLFYGVKFHAGPLYATPELALLAGNVLSFLISKKQRLVLTLNRIVHEGADIYSYYFSANMPVRFSAGQYMEWTLPHEDTDKRGNRRYFTLASSPTESQILLGVKIPSEKPSSFKFALKQFRPGDQIIAGQRAGDFILPEDESLPLVFIAGGIGITPFRSMISNLINTGKKRTITLFYMAPDKESFAYKQIFDTAAQQMPLTCKYVITQKEKAPHNWDGLTGRIDKQMILDCIPDPAERHWMISGPQQMVDASVALLLSLQVPPNRIQKDFFPGF